MLRISNYNQLDMTIKGDAVVARNYSGGEVKTLSAG